MPFEQDLSIYDSWSITYPVLPTRSRLFPLEPIGIGTPYIESLTSYLTRLAESHVVLLGVLVAQEIKAVVPKHYKSRDFFCLKDRTGTANGTGVIAHDLVKALEKLTLRKDLILLTLLKWSQVFPQRKLTRSVKAWCPACYQEWYSENKKIYNPLLWSLNVIKVCPHHQIFLQIRCPCCYQENSPLASNSRLGHCNNCEQWLGGNIPSKTPSKEEISWQAWVVKNLEEILTYTPHSPEAVSRNKISQSFQLSIEQATQGNIAAFARLIGFPKNQVWMWSKGQALPQLETLLKICYFLDLSLLVFLTEENFKINCDHFEKYPLKHQTQQNNRVSDLVSVEKSLKLILSTPQERPSSLTEVAKHLGCNRRTLTRRFPDLCQGISRKYLEYRKSCRLQQIQQFSLEIERTVIELHAQGIYPSESNVSRFLSKPGYFREQEVRAALKKARQKLGIDK